VNDSVDLCPGTSVGRVVDSSGCPINWDVKHDGQTRLQAEAVDRYFDTTTGNEGGGFSSTDVDIQETEDSAGGSYNIGWTDAGEWLEYDYAIEMGSYDFSMRVASKTGGAEYRVLLDGLEVMASNVDSTGGWQQYITQQARGVSVNDGMHTLRIEIISGPVNINFFDFIANNICSDASCTDSDSDGVMDDADQCPNSPAGESVDASGCAFPKDADNDGVTDDADECPNTVAGVAVDANGCAGITGDFGISQQDNNRVTFYVNSDDWAIVHYSVNNGNQLNVGLSNNGVRNELTITGLNVGDVINYSFTYSTGNGAIDTPAQPSYLLTNTQSVDSDGDGVSDALDLCPATPTGSVVDDDGCVVQTNYDIDGVSRIQAEIFDRFWDTTPGNTPGAYRETDVDIEATTDADGGFNIGYTAAGEWLQYDLNASSDNYDVFIRVASAVGNASLQLSVNGDSIGSINVGDTGGWQVFETLYVGRYSISHGMNTFELKILNGEVNINWFEFEPLSPCSGLECLDSDGDGVNDVLDVCPNTPPGKAVDSSGCELSSSINEVQVIGNRLVGGGQTVGPGHTLYTFDNDVNGSTCFDSCAVSWPPLLVRDGSATGYSQLGTTDRGNGQVQVTYKGKPVYFYSGDIVAGDINGQGVGNVWWAIEVGTSLGDIVPLFDSNTNLEPAIQFDRGDALVTRIADRGRDRHAKENHFQAYDHFLTFYWEDRTIQLEIVDYIAKGGDSIRMNVKTLNKLDDRQAENRWFYYGRNTLAEYCGNGVMQTNDNRNYWKESNWNCRENRALKLGDKIEFEISQFLDEATLPRGRSNYYGTTYLYIVGQGIVPWDVTDRVVFTPGNSFQRDSIPIPERARMGGDTSLHVQMTAEPDGHFQQMPTNLAYINSQHWVLGRRVHHSSMLDGSHDESSENGTFHEVAGLAGTHYVNDRCTSCHERNGRAVPAVLGEPLLKWVFKVGDTDGNPHPLIGRVLQPQANSGAAVEGVPTLASWTEFNGLRSPNYSFSNVTPETFSARIAPQLNGMGLLEAISEADILALADEADIDGDGISGKASKVVDPASGEVRLGRFGYKAATVSVKHQVAGALNTDMGVMTSLLPSADCGSAQNDCGPNGAELADEYLNDLVKYVSLLGVRPQRDYTSNDVLRGEQVFNDTGCQSCHTSKFTTSAFAPLAELRRQTIRPYTDLLLHDMGAGLADNLAEGSATGAEWRTAPLWGVGLTACVTGGVTGNRGWDAFGLDGYETCNPLHGYLHDGRARTIDEAIRWHGGEGEASKQAYEALNNSDRNALIRFVESL